MKKSPQGAVLWTIWTPKAWETSSGDDNSQPKDPSLRTAIDSVSEYYLCFRFFKFALLEAQNIAQSNGLMNWLFKGSVQEQETL